jgi:hypothetical protein
LKTLAFTKTRYYLCGQIIDGMASPKIIVAKELYLNKDVASLRFGRIACFDAKYEPK